MSVSTVLLRFARFWYETFGGWVLLSRHGRAHVRSTCVNHSADASLELELPSLFAEALGLAG